MRWLNGLLKQEPTVILLLSDVATFVVMNEKPLLSGVNYFCLPVYDSPYCLVGKGTDMARLLCNK